MARYWLDTNYEYPNNYRGTFGKLALHKVTLDDDGDEVDEIILIADWQDVPNFNNEALADYGLDDYIEKALGFLPEYEVG